MSNSNENVQGQLADVVSDLGSHEYVPRQNTPGTSAMPSERIYLMSMAASGKSTFSRKNPLYSGYRVIDYASRLTERPLSLRLQLYLSRPFPPLQRALRKHSYMEAINERNYFAGVLELMRSHEGPLVVLGRRLPENFEQSGAFQGVAIGLVLIPEEEHRQHCHSRRREMRNPLPFMHHWTTDFDKVLAMRERMKDFAERHHLPVFGSFSAAIDRLGSQRHATPGQRSSVLSG